MLPLTPSILTATSLSEGAAAEVEPRSTEQTTPGVGAGYGVYPTFDRDLWKLGKGSPIYFLSLSFSPGHHHLFRSIQQAEFNPCSHCC